MALKIRHVCWKQVRACSFGAPLRAMQCDWYARQLHAIHMFVEVHTPVTGPRTFLPFDLSAVMVAYIHGLRVSRATTAASRSRLPSIGLPRCWQSCLNCCTAVFSLSKAHRCTYGYKSAQFQLLCANQCFIYFRTRLECSLECSLLQHDLPPDGPERRKLAYEFSFRFSPKGPSARR